MFTLANVTQSQQAKPPRICLYSSSGFGKSTFGSLAPNAIFVPTEDGIDRIQNVNAFPLCKSYGELISCLSALYNEQHQFQTVVLDSVTWAEKLIHAHVVEMHNTNNSGKKIETIDDIGYGKGYATAVTLWSEVLSWLNCLREAKGMMILLLGHETIINFSPPDTEAYNKYTLSLHKKSSACVQEWCDAVMLGQMKTIIKQEEEGFNKIVNKAISTGERIIKCNPSAIFDAKNRYGFPDQLPLDWNAVMPYLYPQQTQ